MKPASSSHHKNKLKRALNALLRALGLVGPENQPRLAVALILVIVLFIVMTGPPPQPSGSGGGTEVHTKAAASHQQQQPFAIPPTIAYMSQGRASSFEKTWSKIKDLKQVQFYFHTFDEPCHPEQIASDNGSNDNKPVCLFHTKTTFAQGRHILLRRAMKDQERLNISYYAFFDDDAQMMCGDELQQAARLYRRQQNKILRIFQRKRLKEGVKVTEETDHMCWRQYTDILLNSAVTDGWPLLRPGFIAIDMDDVFTTKWQTCVDENFYAFHRDYLWLFNPASYKLQEKTWWVKCSARQAIGQRCFPHMWKVDNRFMITNPSHREYPRGLDNFDLKAYLNYTYAPLGPWDDEMLQKYPGGHRCEVSSVPPSSKHVKDELCRETLQNRFNAWKDGTFEPELAMDETATEY